MRLLLVAAAVILSLPLGGAQDGSTPQQDWMVHMDGSGGSWSFVPDRIVLVPGGLVQLMVFGNGQFSLTLEGAEAYDADIRSAEGTIRTAEFHAPATPGEYAFHDKYHPEARGILVVQEATSAPVIGVVPGGYESRFAPDRLEVAPGAEIVFRANGSFGHNLRSVDGAFDAGDLAPGGESRFRAPTTPGEHRFECRYHAAQGMVGTLVVRAPAADAPRAQEAEETRETPVPAWLALSSLLVAWAALRRR